MLEKVASKDLVWRRQNRLSDLDLRQQLVVDAKPDQLLKLWHVEKVLALRLPLYLVHLTLQLWLVSFVVPGESGLVALRFQVLAELPFIAEDPFRAELALELAFKG